MYQLRQLSTRLLGPIKNINFKENKNTLLNHMEKTLLKLFIWFLNSSMNSET